MLPVDLGRGEPDRADQLSLSERLLPGLKELQTQKYLLWVMVDGSRVPCLCPKTRNPLHVTITHNR
jgi:hypothetical protein